MLPNEVFALACRARYKEEGLVVDATNGEFAHCPYPDGMGTTGYYLLHADHQHQGLIQSDDVGRRCFFPAHALSWLLNVDPLPEDYFGLWDIFDQWTKGFTHFLDPDTGEYLYLRSEEAKALGLSGILAGKSVYVNPDTGEKVLISAQEATELGYSHNLAGRSLFRNTLTGEFKQLRVDSSPQYPWVPATSNKVSLRNLDTGETRQFGLDEPRGEEWVGVASGTAVYKDLATGELYRVTPDEARKRDLVALNVGTAVYRNELTGEQRRFPAGKQPEGWVHVNAGRPSKKRKPVEVLFPNGIRQTFACAGDAAKVIGCSSKSVANSANENRPLQSGVIARYI